MSILDSINYVVIPGLNAGSYRGRIDSILEGDSGSEYSIYLRYPNGGNADWVGTITGYYWLIDDESTVYTITGALTIDSGDSSLMVWDVSAVDMAIAGQRRVVFSFGGKKSLSVVMNVEGDPRESVADTPPTVPSLSTVYQSVQDLATVASTGDYNDLINIPAGGGVSLGETSDTAYRGDRGKIAYDHSQLTSGNPHSVTASDVGLGNVDNTSDINKPVSTATQTALNGKVSLSGDTMTGALSVDGSADSVQLTVRANNATQTANLFEIQDGSNSFLSGADSRGVLQSTAGTASTNFFAGESAGTTNAGSHGSNVAIGRFSGNSFTSGGFNMFVGAFSGRFASSGSNNIGVGASSLGSLTTAQSNVAIGRSALSAITSQNYNTAVGHESMAGINDASGSSNVGIGYRSGYLWQIARRNSVVGYEAGYGNTKTNVQDNAIIGYQAGYQGSIGSVFIGFQAGYNETSDNRLYIANSNTSTPLIYGEFNNSLLRANGSFEARGVSDAVQLTVQGHSTQTNNIQEWKNSAGTALSSIDGSGNYQGLIGYFSETVTTADSGAAYALNATSTLNYKLTLTGNCTLSTSNVPSGRVVEFRVEMIQDGTGSRTVTWPGGTTWNGGAAPTLSTGAGDIDVVKLVTFDGGTTWRGDLIGANYS